MIKIAHRDLKRPGELAALGGGVSLPVSDRDDVTSLLYEMTCGTVCFFFCDLAGIGMAFALLVCRQANLAWQKAMARGASNERVFRMIALPLIVRAANLGWHVGGPLFLCAVATSFSLLRHVAPNTFRGALPALAHKDDGELRKVPQDARCADDDGQSAVSFLRYY